MFDVTHQSAVHKERNMIGQSRYVEVETVLESKLDNIDSYRDIPICVNPVTCQSRTSLQGMLGPSRSNAVMYELRKALARVGCACTRKKVERKMPANMSTKGVKLPCNRLPNILNAIGAQRMLGLCSENCADLGMHESFPTKLLGKPSCLVRAPRWAR